MRIELRPGRVLKNGPDIPDAAAAEFRLRVAVNDHREHNSGRASGFEALLDGLLEFGAHALAEVFSALLELLGGL